MALGATFSALEVVPLVLMGFEAWDNVKLSRSTSWIKAYKWPVYCFIAVAFWNLVGAGIFGFIINPPIALYYMQGLNTTPVHGHTALFGIGLAQTVASVKEGLWYARSAEFLHQPAMLTLKWLRVIGDTIFAFGTVALAWFIFGLKVGWSIEKK